MPISNLGFAALGCAVSIASVTAQSRGREAISHHAITTTSFSPSLPRVHSGQHGGTEWHSDGRQFRDAQHRGSDFGDGVVLSDGDYALQAQTWGSDTYNDWWHDRPDRAFPRWVQTNWNCERIWWSGSGWRC